MKNQDSGLCPMLETPEAGCYCTDPSSRNVERILYYCGGHYKECELYRRYQRDRGACEARYLKGTF